MTPIFKNDLYDVVQIRTRNQKRKRRRRTDLDRGRNPGNGTVHTHAVVRLTEVTPSEIVKAVGTGIVVGITMKVVIDDGNGAIAGTSGNGKEVTAGTDVNGVKAGALGNGIDRLAETTGIGVTAATEESETEATVGRKGNGKEAAAEENGIGVTKKSRKGMLLSWESGISCYFFRREEGNGEYNPLAMLGSSLKKDGDKTEAGKSETLIPSRRNSRWSTEETNEAPERKGSTGGGIDLRAKLSRVNERAEERAKRFGDGPPGNGNLGRGNPAMRNQQHQYNQGSKFQNQKFGNQKFGNQNQVKKF